MKLFNVNKYFNKGKSNELHVLNDISLEFPSVGLVAIMGQSGSGKTTLLNALCGLDKIHSGTIEVNDVSITRYKSKVWDNLRNKEFGYIFQNYNIFEDKSVFDNVALSLEFLGMRSKDEIKSRVMQALTLVGMDKYRNRNAGALSGGEMQRVAIARALVKDPTIIIADEPTGNLDEKNTIMIMNILKKIAKERLVILVTHEKEIGEFYADTIVNIQDGKVVSVEDSKNNELKLYADNTIYLQDFNKDTIEKDRITVASYYSEKIDADVKVEIILEGNDIYISATSSSKKIKYVDDDSLVSIVDGKRPQLTKEEIDKTISSVETIDHLDKSALSCKYNIGLFNHIKKGFERVFDLSKFKKLFLLGFVISACLLVLSFSAYIGVQSADETDFLKYDRNLTAIEYKDNQNIEEKYEEIKKLEEKGMINYIYPYTGLYNSYSGTYGTTFATPVIPYFIFDGIADYYNGYALEATYKPYTRVKNYKYVVPNEGEVVIDRFIANQIFSTNLSFGNTIQTEALLKLAKVQIGAKSFKIVGIADENNGCVYINPKDTYSFYFANFTVSYTDSTNSTYYITFDNILEYHGQIDGINSINKGQAIITGPTAYQYSNSINLEGKVFSVVDRIDTTEKETILYLNGEDFEYLLFYCSVLTSSSILFDSNYKVKEIKKELDMDRIYHVDLRYDVDYKEAAREKLNVARVLLAFALVTIVAPLIFLFFLMRSNLISRVKEVGVYRALGLSKGSILKMHASEAIAISATGTFLGWAFGVFIIFKLRSVMFGDMLFSANPLVLVGCLILCVLINLLVGCIPIMTLLRKTPQQILSKYDI